MYNYANAVNLAKNDNSETILINFLQNTPVLSSESDFELETDETLNEVVSSIVLDKNAAFNLINGIIEMYDLADLDEEPNQ